VDDLRVGPLLPLPFLLREFGVDPSSVFARVGVDERLLDDPDNRVSFDSAGRLMDECVAATGCAHLGILVGLRFSRETLGVVHQLARHSPSLREALRHFVLYLHLHDRGGVPYVVYPSPGEAAVAYGIYHRGDFNMAPLYDAAIAVIHALLRDLCGPRWKPTRVTFGHRRPTDVVPYRRLLGAPLVFDAEHSAVVFPARWLDAPLRGSDPAMQRTIARLVGEREAAEAMSMSDRVRRVLRTAVLAGTASADRVAFLFARSRRSLHRQLQAEGTSLQALANDARFEVARQLLAESDMPASEVASALHYSDASAFSRAFKDWAGSSPREWRRKVQARLQSGAPAKRAARKSTKERTLADR
jgi:AraC-like DNA-binding protein